MHDAYRAGVQAVAPKMEEDLTTGPTGHGSAWLLLTCFPLPSSYTSPIPYVENMLCMKLV